MRQKVSLGALPPLYPSELPMLVLPYKISYLHTYINYYYMGDPKKSAKLQGSYMLSQENFLG